MAPKEYLDRIREACRTGEAETPLGRPSLNGEGKISPSSRAASGCTRVLSFVPSPARDAASH